MFVILRRSQSLGTYRPVLGTTTIPNDHNRPHSPAAYRLVGHHHHAPLLTLTPQRNFTSSFYASVASSTPVSYLQHGLVQLHDVTGLPWWATIMLYTITLRTIVTLPLSIHQNQVSARLELAHEEMSGLVKQMKMEAVMLQRKGEMDEATARRVFDISVKKHWQTLIERDNCHPAKKWMVPLAQIPLWVSLSFAIRNVLTTTVDGQLLHADVSVGGFGWMPDLTMNDGTLILPVTMALVNLTIGEIVSLRTSGMKKTKYSVWMDRIFRSIAVVMIPVVACVPSGLALYWTTSASMALLQSILLMSPKFKQLTAIPMNVKSHMDHPYQFIAAAFMHRIHTNRLLLWSKKKSFFT